MNKTKPNVLIFIDWFVPAYKAGGPIQSVLNMVQKLNSFYNFYIVTSDADIDSPLDISKDQKNKWLNKDDYQVMYLDNSHQNKTAYRSIFQELDFRIVYLNSLFSVRFTLLPLLAIHSKKAKIILAPRGMLGRGALKIKPLKKKIFIKVFKTLGWHKKVSWQATALTEKTEIQHNFGHNTNIYVASNLSKKSYDSLPVKNKLNNKLNVFFLSRISFKKNLIQAIKCLGLIKHKYEICFTIIGPVEDETYWGKCQEEIKALPEHIKTISLGAQPNQQLQQILKDQHVLLLPTHNENFGHVIVESWQNACPVIISDQTPWTQLEDKKVGFEIALKNKKEFTGKIEMFASMDESEFNQWSLKAKEYGDSISNDESLLSKYQEMFS